MRLVTVCAEELDCFGLKIEICNQQYSMTLKNLIVNSKKPFQYHVNTWWTLANTCQYLLQYHYLDAYMDPAFKTFVMFSIALLCEMFVDPFLRTCLPSHHCDFLIGCSIAKPYRSWIVKLPILCPLFVVGIKPTTHISKGDSFAL